MKKTIRYLIAGLLIAAAIVIFAIHANNHDRQHMNLVGVFLLLVGGALFVVTSVAADYVKPKKDEMPRMFWNYDGSETKGELINVKITPNMLHNNLPPVLTVKGIEYMHPDEHKRRMEDAFYMARDKITLPPDHTIKTYSFSDFHAYWQYHLYHLNKMRPK